MIRSEPWTWVSFEKVAEQFSNARNCVHRWTVWHRMPAHRVGRTWTSKLALVETWGEASGAEADERGGGDR